MKESQQSKTRFETLNHLYGEKCFETNKNYWNNMKWACLKKEHSTQVSCLLLKDRQAHLREKRLLCSRVFKDKQSEQQRFLVRKSGFWLVLAVFPWVCVSSCFFCFPQSEVSFSGMMEGEEKGNGKSSRGSILFLEWNLFLKCSGRLV